MYIHGHTLILANAFYIKQCIPSDYTIAEIGSNRKTWSTIALGKLCRDNSINFISVDNDLEIAINAARRLRINEIPGEVILREGTEYLASLDPSSLAVLYLDAVDLEVEGCSSWHNIATGKAVDKIVPGGFICFDDTWLDYIWEGKGEYAVPGLLEDGWKIISYLPYSVLLQKPTAFTLPKYNKLAFWIQFIKYRYIKKWITLILNN